MSADLVPASRTSPRRVGPWRAVASLLSLDLRGVLRDDVLLTNLAVSALVTAGLTILGATHGQDPAWRAWMPACFALAIVTGPPSWGFLFGLLMVEEHETGVRRAIAVTPIPITIGLSLRASLAFGLVFVWSAISLTAMNATWHALPTTSLSNAQWVSFIAASSLGAPLTALVVATWSTNKIEALAAFKAINFVVLAPLASFALPATSWLRLPLFVSPSAWGLAAFDGLRQGGHASAWIAAWAAVHLLGLAFTVRSFARRHMGGA